MCDVVFDVDQTTEEHPLFCPFCGENVGDIFNDDPEADGSETENYLDALFKASYKGLDEDESYE
jgi:hypothetical protein